MIGAIRMGMRMRIGMKWDWIGKERGKVVGEGTCGERWVRRRDLGGNR
jgi:hypothetical protein